MIVLNWNHKQEDGKPSFKKQQPLFAYVCNFDLSLAWYTEFYSKDFSIRKMERSIKIH